MKITFVYSETISLMPTQKIPLLNFYEGRAYYAMGKYEAVLSLENFTKVNKVKSKRAQNSLLASGKLLPLFKGCRSTRAHLLLLSDNFPQRC